MFSFYCRISFIFLIIIILTIFSNGSNEDVMNGELEFVVAFRQNYLENCVL